jgi:hypothetical protein
MRILSRVALATVVVVLAMRAAAHPMPASEIVLDLEANGVRAELRLPLDRLQIAAGSRLQLEAGTTTTTMNRRAIEAYISEHFALLDPNGTSWDARFERVAIVADGAASELQVRLWLSPRERSSSARSFRVRSDLIVHQLVTHKIVVSIGRDALQPKAVVPEILGRLTYRVGELAITRDSTR